MSKPNTTPPATANRTGERANGFTPNDNNLVPISIITGTRTKRGYK